MVNKGQEKHNKDYPSARQIRRACNKELYRTIKKLKIWISPARVVEAEELYFKTVLMNLPFIVENGSNRKRLSDWWEENVCAEIAALWNVECEALAHAFRHQFGG
jgi:trehalose-6-phosphatase